MATPPMASVFCPACGQALTIPLHDLSAQFPCPRCQTWHVAGDLTDRKQPIVVSTLASTRPAAASPSAALTSAVMSPTIPSAALAGVAENTAPPQSGATRSVPDALISGGLLAAGAGISAARHSTSWLLNVADRADALLDGRRALVLGVAAVVGVLVQLFGAPEQRELWGLVAGGVFLAALATVTLAFVARCRDDVTRRFSTELLQERVATFFATLDEFAMDLREAPLPVQALLVGRSCVIVGFVISEALILTLKYELLAFSPSAIVVPLWVTSIGAIAWVWGWRSEVSEEGSTSHRAPPLGSNAVGLGVLPPVVNSADTLPPSGDPMVDGLLEHLCSWRPGRLASESEYQERLYRSLRRKRHEMTVAREHRVSTRQGAMRRIDLLLESSAGRVAVELKSKYDAAACQRAIGQAEEYAEIGFQAVVLVLCDPQVDSPNVHSLLDKVTKMRERGLPIVTVLAVAQGARGRLTIPNTMQSLQSTAPSGAAPSAWGPIAMAAVATAFAASSWNHPPPGLRTLAAPAARSAPPLDTGSTTSATPNAFPALACTAIVASAFHLRPTPTMASVGPEYAAGTQLTVFEFTGLTRRASKLFRVQTSDGASGYAFLSPRELSPWCPQ